MLTIQQAARKFRFAKWDEITAAEKAFLRQHVDEVANALPTVIGADLYESLDLPVPDGFVGTDDSSEQQAMRERIAYETENKAGT